MADQRHAVTSFVRDSAGTDRVFRKQWVPPQPEVMLTSGDCSYPAYIPTNGNAVAFIREDTLTGYTQVSRVAVASVPPPPMQLTFSQTDKEGPVEWSPNGQYLLYVAPDDNGYDHIWRVPAAGGQEQQLTSGQFDDAWPNWLSNNEIIFQRWPDEDYVQVYKLNLSTSTLTALTSYSTDHEYPCPSYSGSKVCYTVLDNSGTYQIGLADADGSGEQTLTSELAYDLEQPDFSADGVSVFCTRTVSLNSEIGVVDARQGGYEAVTDASAIRDNPDVYFGPAD